jgi:hypothetical protein
LAAYIDQITELPWEFLCKDGSEITCLVLEICATDQVLFGWCSFFFFLRNGWCSWLRASAKLVLASSPIIRRFLPGVAGQWKMHVSLG